MRCKHDVISAIRLGTLFVVVAGVGLGCTVGFDPTINRAFICESDDDCIEGFECSEDGEDEGTCVQIVITDEPDALPCDQEANPEDDIDLDNDGFGDGTIRTNCPAFNGQKPRDCDDNDETVFPGAAELCDGKDNNCDAEDVEGPHRVDEVLECESALEDCGGVPSHLRNHYTYICENNQCVLRPPVRPVGSPCEQIVATCNTSEQRFTYEAEGQTYSADEGPVLDCN